VCSNLLYSITLSAQSGVKGIVNGRRPGGFYIDRELRFDRLFDG
jgi:hypothetical protein